MTLREAEELTTAKIKSPLALHKDVDGLLLLLDLVADDVDVAEQTDVVGEESKLGSRA